jgi:hypothetical protein
MTEELDTTPQTRQALEGVCQQVAGDLGINEKLVYAIRYGDKPDAYAHFKHRLFRPVLRAGGVERARIFVNDLISELDAAERRASAPAEGDLACDVVTQFEEWLKARIKEHPPEVQRKELSDIVTAATRLMGATAPGSG